MSRAATDAPSARGEASAERRLALMESKPLRENAVIAGGQPGQKPGAQAPLLRPGQIGSVTGLPQKARHRPRPRLLLNVDERLEFPQMMRVTQRVGHADHGQIWPPEIMDDDPTHAGQHRASLGRRAVARQQPGGGDMQPLQHARNAIARFV